MKKISRFRIDGRGGWCFGLYHFKFAVLITNWRHSVLNPPPLVLTSLQTDYVRLWSPDLPQSKYTPPPYLPSIALFSISEGPCDVHLKAIRITRALMIPNRIESMMRARQPTITAAKRWDIVQCKRCSLSAPYGDSGAARAILSLAYIIINCSDEEIKAER